MPDGIQSAGAVQASCRSSELIHGVGSEAEHAAGVGSLCVGARGLAAARVATFPTLHQRQLRWRPQEWWRPPAAMTARGRQPVGNDQHAARNVGAEPAPGLVRRWTADGNALPGDIRFRAARTPTKSTGAWRCLQPRFAAEQPQRDRRFQCRDSSLTARICDFKALLASLVPSGTPVHCQNGTVCASGLVLVTARQRRVCTEHHTFPGSLNRKYDHFSR